MKLTNLLLFAAALPALVARGGAEVSTPPLTVAVYDFSEGNRVGGNTGRVISAIVASSLYSEQELMMLERAELGKTLNEQAFGVAGLVSTDAAAEIGQLTGAKVLVAGQIVHNGNRMILVATIVGTESGRLFATRVEGTGDRVVELATELSGKIGQLIRNERTNLVALSSAANSQSNEEFIRSLPSGRRPVASLNIHYPAHPKEHSFTSEGELGALLLKAGFAVVSDTADRRPDVEITGVMDVSVGRTQGALFRGHGFLEIKVQERRNGNILLIDRQESTSVAGSRVMADQEAQANGAREMARRILPVIAKDL